MHLQMHMHDRRDAVERAGRGAPAPPAAGPGLVAFLTAAVVAAGCGLGATPDREEPGTGAETSTSRPLVIAHRGASAHAPEHTMAAYELALERGADYIEQDLQLTRDGVLVVLHDDSLDRTVRGPAERCSGPVRARTAAELEACDAGRWFNEARPERARPEYVGLGIPTLREVLERFGRTARFYIETKTPESAPGMEEALIEELDRAGLLPADASDRTVLVQSFSEPSLRRLHELHPALPLVRLFSDDGPPRPPDDVLARTAEYAIAIGPSRGRVDAGLVEAARRHGLEVHPWTVNDEAEMERLLELGVGGLFTDHPGRLRQLLEGR